MNGLEQRTNTKGINGSTNLWHEPKYLGFSTPAIPDEANTHEHRTGDKHGQAVLRLGHSIVTRNKFKIYILNQWGTHQQTNNRADAKSNIHKAGNTDTETVLFGPKCGVRNKHQVHEPINECHM